MAFDTWLTYFAAAWIISLSPGTGAVFAMSSGLNHGFRRSWPGTLGLVIGVWTALAIVAIGLGALLNTSAHAFNALKWLGAAYLAYLGVQQWRGPAKPLTTDSERREAIDARTLFARGWAVNASNPKGIVFMMAVMPQFIDSHAPLLPQYLAIGATSGVTELVVMALYAALAARVLGFFRSARQQRLLNRIFGGLFIAAAVALLTFKRDVAA